MSRTAQYAAHFAGSSEVEASPGPTKRAVYAIGGIHSRLVTLPYKPLENEANPQYRPLDVDLDGSRVILVVEMQITVAEIGP